MSELIQKNDNRATIRWKLLTGASALALTAYISSANIALAGDADRPLVWIEVNGQLNRLQDGQEIYAPPFLALTPSIFSPPQKTEQPPRYSLDEGASISFQPEDSNWIFSASVQYGRTGATRHEHQQTYPSPYQKYARGTYFGKYFDKQYTTVPLAARFMDAKVKNSESHAILDFQAGKDIGLGLFGGDTNSTLNFGVRIAQLKSKSRVSLNSDPDWNRDIATKYFSNPPYYDFALQTGVQSYHSYAGRFRADRSFHGIGPSLAWKSSMPFAGNPRDGELDVDWGVNAAVLFGRQSTKTSHQTSGKFGRGRNNAQAPISHGTVYQHGPYPHTRSRTVTVPNVGGFAGISLRYVDAKISLGYKADFFFGAIDGGIDAAKKENRGFYGPYASISIGLGD